MNTIVHYGIDASLAVLATVGVGELAVLAAAILFPPDIEFDWPETEDEGKP